MALRFIVKRFADRPKNVILTADKKAEAVEEKPKNKKGKKAKDMTPMEQIAAAELAAENMMPEVKVVKQDRGLIERTESSKIVLTEDNRQVLND